MSRLKLTAAAMIIAGLAASGCARNRNLPTQLAPSRMTTIGVNGYLWQAALETLHFMPIVSTDATGGVIVTDWYTDPSAPNERVKMRVAVMDARLRADALKVSINRQAKDRSGEWVDQPVQQATVAGIEDAILVRARQIRIGTVTEKED